MLSNTFQPSSTFHLTQHPKSRIDHNKHVWISCSCNHCRPLLSRRDHQFHSPCCTTAFSAQWSNQLFFGGGTYCAADPDVVEIKWRFLLWSALWLWHLFGYEVFKVDFVVLSGPHFILCHEKVEFGWVRGKLVLCFVEGNKEMRWIKTVKPVGRIHKINDSPLLLNHKTNNIWDFSLSFREYLETEIEVWWNHSLRIHLYWISHQLIKTGLFLMVHLSHLLCRH